MAEQQTLYDTIRKRRPTQAGFPGHGDEEVFALLSEDEEGGRSDDPEPGKGHAGGRGIDPHDMKFLVETYHGYVRFSMIMDLVSLLICVGLLVVFFILDTDIPSSFLEIPVVLTATSSIYTRVVNVLSAPFSLAWLLFSMLALSCGFFVHNLMQELGVLKTLQRRTSSLASAMGDLAAPPSHPHSPVGDAAQIQAITTLILNTPAICFMGSLLGLSGCYLAFTSALYSISHIIPIILIPVEASLAACMLFGRRSVEPPGAGVLKSIWTFTVTSVTLLIVAGTYLTVPIMSFTTKSMWIQSQMASAPRLFTAWRSPPIVVLLFDILYLLFVAGYLLRGPHYILFKLCSTTLVVGFAIMMTAITLTGLRGESGAYDTRLELELFLYGQ
jgi:hypothetical protein